MTSETEHFTLLISRNLKVVYGPRTTNEGGYFASLGNSLFNRKGKRVSVRTRKVPLAFKLLFLLFFLY